MVFLVR